MPKLPDSYPLNVYIPTRGRLRKQYTMNNFHLSTMPLNIQFVVPECECREFQELYPTAPNIVVPSHFKLGSVMEHIIKEWPGRYKLFIDDDLCLMRRRDPTSTKQTGSKGTRYDVQDLFDRVRYWFKQGYTHGGISLRQTNQFVKDNWYKENTRCSGMLFYDTAVLIGENICADAVQDRSDFHITLSLLELGYANIVDYEFMGGQVGNNAVGGCTSYRTFDFMLSEALKLSRLHDHVDLVYKKLKTRAANPNPEQGVPDVRVGWKIATGTRAAMRDLSFIQGIQYTDA